MDTERLRNALLTARRLPGLASPVNLDLHISTWVLRPLAVGALLLRDLEYDSQICKKIKSDEADLRALPSLRAEPVGRDKAGNCHWAFRGEREYRYAPQRVWVQQCPDSEVQQKPSWGYTARDGCCGLVRHLDRDDESEALGDKLLLRVPPGVASGGSGVIKWRVPMRGVHIYQRCHGLPCGFGEVREVRRGARWPSAARWKSLAPGPCRPKSPPSAPPFVARERATSIYPLPPRAAARIQEV